MSKPETTAPAMAVNTPSAEQMSWGRSVAEEWFTPGPSLPLSAIVASRLAEREASLAPSADAKEEKKRAQEIVAPYRKKITDTPALLSLLYDIDLLPEQITRIGNAARMIAVCLQAERVAVLVDALRGVLPYMEAAEKAGLVGDEGCHWPVEIVRAALSAAGADQQEKT